jgi:hypothetical protein
MTLADWINAVLAFVTALMAGGTVYLAWYTRNLAKDTVAGIRQAERHHREDSRPFCVIDFANADANSPFGIGFHRQQAMMAVYPSASGTDVALMINGSLSNKGHGPATDILIYLNMRRGPGEEYAYRLTRPVVVSGLIAAGEAAKIEVAITEQDIMKIWNGSAWTPVQVFHAIAGDTYEVVLEYRDVFGNFFRTVHPRGHWTDTIADAAAIGDKAEQHEMMARPNRPMPIFLTGRQAMCTPADFPLIPSAPPPIAPEETEGPPW